MITIQLFGVVIGLAALNMTFLYYKRSNFTKRELVFWFVIWLAFIFIALFPRSISPIVGALGLERPMDLIMIIAFIILFILTFHNYIVLRRQADKLERMVRSLALKDLDNDRT